MRDRATFRDPEIVPLETTVFGQRHAAAVEVGDCPVCEATNVVINDHDCDSRYYGLEGEDR